MTTLGTPDADLGTSAIAQLSLGTVEALFDRLADAPFFVKDAALRYVAANRAMLALCGVRALIGQRAADLFPATAAARYERLDRRVLATGRAVEDRLELVTTKAAPPTWLLFTRLPVTDAGGRTVGVAAISRRLPAPDRRHPTYDRVSATATRLEAGLDRPLDLGALARAALVSPSQLERDFRGLFGLTLSQYQAKLRIDAALTLLDGPEPIARVAQACGFADQSAFSRRFRAVLGLSPSAYRQRLGR